MDWYNLTTTMRLTYQFCYIIVAYILHSCNEKPPEEKKYETSLGTGYNTVLEEETGQGIEPAPIIDSDGTKGGKCTGYADLITNYKDFAKTTNLSVDANFKLFGAKVNSSASMFRSFKFNNKSQFLYAEITLVNPSKRLERAVFTEEAKKIAEKDIRKFYQLYGDEYEYLHERGGKLKIIYEFKSSNHIEEEQNTFQISVVKKFFNSGFSVNTKFQEQLSTVENNENISIYFYREGDYQPIPKLTFDSLLQYYRDFPSIVKPGSDMEVVTKKHTKSYKYASNKPKNIDQLGEVVDEVAKYINILNEQLNSLYESYGNIRYIKENRSDFSQSFRDKINAREKIVESQIKETIDYYDSFKQTGKLPISITKLRQRHIELVSVPESPENEYLPNIIFGEECVNNKVYYGRISVPGEVFFKVEGSLNFLGKQYASGILSFPPDYRQSFIEQQLAGTPLGDRVRNTSTTDQWETPNVTPVHVYLHDFNTKRLVREYIYVDDRSVKIPPGKYEIYVSFDTKGRLITNNPGGVVQLFVKKNRFTMNEDDVVNIPPGAKLTGKFYRNVEVKE